MLRRHQHHDDPGNAENVITKLAQLIVFGHIRTALFPSCGRMGERACAFKPSMTVAPGEKINAALPNGTSA